MRSGFFAGLFLSLSLFMAIPAGAVEPDEVLDDPALEARARALSAELRCLVCRNQSIDDSNADLARDLRILLRERLVSGDTDAEAMAFLVDRYGNFIRLKPPFQATTVLLWIGPLLLLGAAVLGFRSLWSSKAELVPETELTEADKAMIAKLIQPKETQ